MNAKPPHLSERDLILAAGRELGARGGKSLRDHLESCRDCRARTVSLQEGISEFVRAMTAEQTRRQRAGRAGTKPVIEEEDHL